MHGAKYELGGSNQLGYLKIHVSFPMKDGLNGEIQIHTKEGWIAKKDTDPIYKEWGKWENKEVPEGLIDARNEAVRESLRKWDNYWSKVPGGSSEISFSVKGLHLLRYPNVGLKGAPPEDSLLIGGFPSCIGETSTNLPSGPLDKVIILIHLL
jgi:hypothetical protein